MIFLAALPIEIIDSIKVFGVFFSILIAGLLLDFVLKKRRRHLEKIRKIENERIESLLRDNLKSIVPHIYNLLNKKLETEYPYINFQPPSIIKILEDISALKISINIKNNIDLVFRNYYWSMQSNFLSNPKLGLNGYAVKPDKSAFHSLKNFWTFEEFNQVNKNGKLPPDWELRRQIVFERDRQRCRKCGLSLTIDTCHIHHSIRRSDGGNHSFENLITLCKDCHTTMPGHDKLISFRSYYIRNKKIHDKYCRYRGTKKLIAYYPDLRKRGYEPCKFCRPWEIHDSAKYSYEYNFKKTYYNFYEESFLIIKLKMPYLFFSK